MKIDIPRLVLAAPHSGSGKTVITSGLLAALAQHKTVQAFKVGPDYIDPMYHAAATGRPGRNLDGWMLPEDMLPGLFGRACRGADMAVIEGVMGLFDGYDGKSDSGSTARMAKLLGTPVVLVVDASKMARSVAALVGGFRDYDPELKLAGVICNRVGSPTHANMLRDALADIGMPVYGMLPRDEALAVPERHLGLLTAVERGEQVNAFLQGAGDLMRGHLDIDGLLRLAASASAFDADEFELPAACVPPGSVRLAVARDEAFCFYYEDNLDLLRAAGADIVFFSPLRDEELPEGTAGLYIGGGYPELYAAGLSANGCMLAALRRAHEGGMPIYAECGGLMLLTQAIVDLQGQRHDMADIIPGVTRMQQRLSLGYCHITAERDTLLLRRGEELRGHEFHYSSWDVEGVEDKRAYRKTSHRSGVDVLEGYAGGNLLASYLHLHFAAQPELARRLVEASWNNGLWEKG